MFILAIVKHVLSISLIVSILSGILGLEVGIHRCGGELKSMALFKPATPCAHAEASENQENLPSCHRHLFAEDKKDNAKGCCEDEYHELEILEIEVIHDSSQWVALSDIDLPIWIKNTTQPAFFFQYITPEYLNYKPPLISASLHKLIQVYLI